MASTKRLFWALFRPRRRARPLGTCRFPVLEGGRPSEAERLLVLRRQERALRGRLGR